MHGFRENTQISFGAAKISEPVLLSYAQQRIWLMHQLEHDSTEYNMLWAQRLRGKLDIAALRKAINTIVQRHEALRTCISESNGQVTQFVAPFKEVEIAIEDLTHLDAADQQEGIKAALRKEGNEPIDLSHGPMLRTRLLKLAQHEHVWLRVVHHINFDGWSDGVFCKELNALYNAFSQGKENPLKSLPFQYKDFALWQRRVPGDDVNQGLAYWRKKLAGIPEQMDLPMDGLRGTNSIRGSGLHHVNLSTQQIAAIKRLSQVNGATLYMTMLSAFAVLLARYVNQDDIVIGSPIANRRSAVLEGTIGCFVNSLVLRIQLRPGMTFRELLRDVRETALEAYEHQDVPFERIVEDISPRRSPNRTPLFQVFFSMQDTPSYPLRLHGLEAEPPFRGERVRSRFDLELQVSLREGEPTLTWSYKRDLFDDWRIEQMARHFVTIIDAIVADLDKDIRSFDPLGSEDRRLLLDLFNNTQHELPEITLPTLFENEVQKNPDATAVIFGEAAITYRQLNERANRLAHCLIARGVGCEDIVAIGVERTPDLIVAVLGTLKSGAAFLPLDPDYPAARLAFTLYDANPKCVLTTVTAQSKLPHTAEQLFIDVGYACSRSELPVHDPVDCERIRPLSLTSSAYLIYTSGSTGKPKGVGGLHIGLVNRLQWFNSLYPFQRSERVLARTSISFIDGLTELLGPLVHGAPVVLADSSSAKNPYALINLIGRWQIGRITLVPSLLRAILDERKLDQLRFCKLWISSGEALPASYAKRLLDAFPQAQLLNLYGCSECSGDSLFAKCDKGDIVVGEPIWNTRVYILNDRLQLVPLGVKGELYIGGVGVGTGYWRQPQLTAERFMVDPYGPPESRMYRTGDVAQWQRDGKVKLLGRVDRQVQIRGQRIELAEVEAALRDQPSVRDAVVVEWNESHETRLVAYVVPFTKQLIDTYDLRRKLMEVLPDYMIPTSFQTIESLPTLMNGKLDFGALPLPTILANTSSRGPRNEREEILCSLFAEVLKVDRVGIDDDFFDMGGHSLLATLLINRIRNTFGIEFTLRTLLEAATVATLSEQYLEPQLTEPTHQKKVPRVSKLSLEEASGL